VVSQRGGRTKIESCSLSLSHNRHKIKKSRRTCVAVQLQGDFIARVDAHNVSIRLPRLVFHVACAEIRSNCRIMQRKITIIANPKHCDVTKRFGNATVEVEQTRTWVSEPQLVASHEAQLVRLGKREMCNQLFVQSQYPAHRKIVLTLVDELYVKARRRQGVGLRKNCRRTQ
jgi:hypothetical protein